MRAGTWHGMGSYTWHLDEGGGSQDSSHVLAVCSSLPEPQYPQLSNRDNMVQSPILYSAQWTEVGSSITSPRWGYFID